MKINWNVRFKNPKWVIGFISQLLIIAELFVAGGHSAGLWSFVWTEQINTWVLAVTNAILLALAMLGVVQDPTTADYSDSDMARTYKKPRDDTSV